MPRYTCPQCSAVLEPPKAIAPGKRIRCPDCQHIFVPVPVADPDEPGYALGVEEPATKPTLPKPKPIARAAAKPAGAPKPKPVQAKPPVDDDDDDEGTYGLKAAAEETEEQKKNKPAFGEVKDRWKKSKRPYALAKVTGPGNWLLPFGLFQAIFFFCGIMYHLIPIVTPIEERKENKDDPPPVVSDKDKDKDKKKTEGGRTIYSTSDRVMWIAIYAFGMVYSVVIAIGASSMNDLQSIVWGYIAAIMQLIATIPILLLYFMTLWDWAGDWFYGILPGAGAVAQGMYPGVSTLKALSDPEVKAGFAEKKPDR